MPLLNNAQRSRISALLKAMATGTASPLAEPPPKPAQTKVGKGFKQASDIAAKSAGVSNLLRGTDAYTVHEDQGKSHNFDNMRALAKRLLGGEYGVGYGEGKPRNADDARDLVDRFIASNHTVQEDFGKSHNVDDMRALTDRLLNEEYSVSYGKAGEPESLRARARRLLSGPDNEITNFGKFTPEQFDAARLDMKARVAKKKMGPDNEITNFGKFTPEQFAEAKREHAFSRARRLLGDGGAYTVITDRGKLGKDAEKEARQERNSKRAEKMSQASELQFELPAPTAAEIAEARQKRSDTIARKKMPSYAGASEMQVELPAPTAAEIAKGSVDRKNRAKSKAATLTAAIKSALANGENPEVIAEMKRERDVQLDRAGLKKSMWDKIKGVDPMIAAEVAAPIAGGGIGAAIAPEGKRLRYALGGAGIGGIAGLIGEAYRRGMFDRK